MSRSAAPTLRCRVARSKVVSSRQNRTLWFHPPGVARLAWNTIGFLGNAFRIVVPARISETSVPAIARSCPDCGRDAELGPEGVEVMLVAITDMEHQHRWTVNRAPVSFGVRAVQPDGMLVVGDHVMEGGPEGAARPLGQGPKKPSTWSRPW
jgi:hypothetical protein